MAETAGEYEIAKEIEKELDLVEKKEIWLNPLPMMSVEYVYIGILQSP